MTAKAEVTMRDPGWWVGSKVLYASESFARSDTEPALLALFRDVSTAMLDVEMYRGKEDDQQNGLAEASVLEVKGQSRVANSELEKFDSSGDCKLMNQTWHGCDMQRMSSILDAAVQDP